MWIRGGNFTIYQNQSTVGAKKSIWYLESAETYADKKRKSMRFGTRYHRKNEL